MAADKAFAFLQKVLWGVEEVVINKLTNDETYSDLGSRGKILSWVESLPVIGQTLQSLGPQRKKLYKIILETEPKDLVGTIFPTRWSKS